MIQLKLVTVYKDGGTESYLATDELGSYLGGGYVICLDNRLGSQTKGYWYIGYPEKNNGNMLDVDSSFVQNLNKAITVFKNQ